MSGSAFSELRTHLDGSDSFVRGGHRVMKTAGATRHAARMKRVPVWARDEGKIKQFINYRFPKAKIDPEQRRLASRMIRIIYMYYQVGATRGAIAEELKMTSAAVRQVIYRLERAMKQPLKPSHRPKKGVTIGTTSGNSGDDSHITL